MRCAQVYATVVGLSLGACDLPPAPPHPDEIIAAAAAIDPDAIFHSLGQEGMAEAAEARSRAENQTSSAHFDPVLDGVGSRRGDGLSADRVAHALASDACASRAAESWMDMSSWLQAGRTPKWKVMDGGRTLEQYVNSPDPGFYVSNDDEIIDVVIKGTIEVYTQKNPDGTPVGIDNDFIGLALGMHKPIPGGNLQEYDGMLFSWGGSGDRWPTHSFLMIQKLNGTAAQGTSGHCGGDQGACFWFRWDGQGDPAHEVGGAWWNSVGGAAYCSSSASCLGFCDGYCCNGVTRARSGCFYSDAAEDTGWRMDQRYALAVLFTEDSFRVSIDGTVRLDVTQQDVLDKCKAPFLTDPSATAQCVGDGKKAWRKGRMAWYNLSQNGVRYGNIRKFQLEKGQGAEPVAGPDIYGVVRNTAQTHFLPVTKSFFDGLLANDWSPSLAAIEMMVAPQYGMEPLLQVGAVMNVTCEYNSTLMISRDGSFTYFPVDNLVTIAENNKPQERCDYRAFDQAANLRSNVTDVLFALQPRYQACDPVWGCFNLTWQPENYTTPWYRSLVNFPYPGYSCFGDMVASGGCGVITEWDLPDGGASGRFTMGGSQGNKICAQDKSRITLQFLERTFHKMKVKATDVFGQSQQMEITVVLPAECEEVSKCVCVSNIAACECLPGFTGPACDQCIDNRQPIAVNPNCTICKVCPDWNGPPPEAANASGMCLYPEGKCDTYCTRQDTCSDHGNCSVGVATAGQCDCDTAWNGTACDSCAANWYPAANKTPAGAVVGCDTFCTRQATCTDHGNCTAQGTCVCEPCWSGARCDQCDEGAGCYPPGQCNLQCTSANCSLNGNCSLNSNGWPEKCNCTDGWVASQLSGPVPPGCSVPCNRSVTCTGHGDCREITVDPFWTCDCDPHFTNTTCNKCEPGWFPEGVCNTTCNRTVACNDHGNCSDVGTCICDTDPVNSPSRGAWQGTDCSVCLDNYYPPAGNPKGSCNTYCTRNATCTGHGNCTNLGLCDCDKGYTGSSCNECDLNWYDPVSGVCDTYCEPVRTCSGHGNCTADGTACVCETHQQGYWLGDDCGTICTRDLNCSSHGSCTTNGTCECDDLFTHERCEDCVDNWYPPHQCTTFCEPLSNCSGHGTCNWQTGACWCMDEWTGPNCSENVPVPKEPPVEPTAPLAKPDPPSAPVSIYGYAPGDPIWGAGALAPVAWEVEECPIMEIGGMCLGWLLLLLLMVIFCLVCLAVYLLVCRKKPRKRRQRPSKEPFLDQNKMFDPAGTDALDGLDQAAKDEEPDGLNMKWDQKPPETKPAPAEDPTSMAWDQRPPPALEKKEDPGLNMAWAATPPADATPKLGPPRGEEPGTNMAWPEQAPAPPPSGAPDKPAEPGLSMAWPQQAPAGPALGAAPDSAGGFNMAWPQQAPGGPGFGPGNLSADPLVKSAERRGAVPEAAQRAVDRGGMPKDNAVKLSDALTASRAADAGLRSRVQAAVAASQMPQEAKQQLAEALKTDDWTGADLSGVDPHVRKAALTGKLPEMARAVLAAQQLPASVKPQLADALKESDAKHRDLVEEAKRTAANPSVPDATKDDLSRALDGAGPSMGFGWGAGALDGMSPQSRAPAAIATGRVPTAVRQVQGHAGVPDEHKKAMKDSLGKADKAEKQLADALAAAAKIPGLPPATKQLLDDALNPGWGPGDAAGMDPMQRQALKSGQKMELARAALGQPGGVPGAAGQKLADALKGADDRAGGVRRAAEAAAADPKVPEQSRKVLQDALGQQRPPQEAGLNMGEGFGRPPAAVPGGLGPGGAPEPGGPNMGAGFAGLGPPGFGPGAIGDMDPLARVAEGAVADGKVPAAVRQVKDQRGVPDQHKKSLKDALGKADAADRALGDALAAAARAPGVSPEVKKVLDAAAKPLAKVSPGDQDAARAGQKVAAAKVALGMPGGVPGPMGQRLRDALKQAEGDRAGLRSAAEAAAADPAVQPAPKQVLKDALGQQEPGLSMGAGFGPPGGLLGPGGGGGGGGGFDFAPASLSGMDPGARGSPPAAAAPPKQDPLSRAPAAAAARGKVPTAVRDVKGHQGVPDRHKHAMDQALARADAADGAVRDAAQAALAAPGGGGLSPEGRRILEAALAPDFAAGDLAGMDPAARAAVKSGQTPEVVRIALQQQGGVGDPTRSKLQEALRNADSQAAAMRGVAETAARDPTLPQRSADVLRDALGQGVGPSFGGGFAPPPGMAAAGPAAAAGPGVPSFGGGALDNMDPIQRAAAQRAGTTQAAKAAVGAGAAAPALKQALGASEAADEKLEQAVRSAAKTNPSTLGDWGAGDLGGMDPVARRAIAAENARHALRQPGLDTGTRDKLQKALTQADQEHKHLVDAGKAAAAQQGSQMPAAARAALESGAPAFTGAQLDGMEPVLRGALSRGRVPVAVDKALASPSMPQSVAQPLRAAAAKNAASSKNLADVAKRLAGGSALPAATKAFLQDALSGRGWEGGDVDGMDPLKRDAVNRGRLPVAIRAALREPGIPQAERAQLEDALRQADAAAAALAQQGSQALADPQIPPDAAATLAEAGLKPAARAAAPVASLLGGPAPPTGPSFGAPDSSALSGMDPMQRAAIARGRAAEAGRQNAAQLPDQQRRQVEDAIKSGDAADAALADGVRMALKDPALAQHHRRLLQDALADNEWGAAPDLEGMDPVARAALARGQLPEAVRAMLRQDDVPGGVKANLQKLLTASDGGNARVTEAAQNAAAAGGPQEVTQALRQAVDAAKDPWSGFDGNVALDQGWGPIARANIRGAVPEAVRQVVAASAPGQHAILRQQLAQSDQHFTELTAVVRSAMQQPGITPEAKKRLEDALAGKWGPGDTSGMDPVRAAEGGLVPLAVRSVLEKGGVSGAARQQLEAALGKQESHQKDLTAAVRAAIQDPGTSAGHKRQLGDALYGKVRSAQDTGGVGATEVDVAGTEFAPLAHVGGGVDAGFGGSLLGGAKTGGQHNMMGLGIDLRRGRYEGVERDRIKAMQEVVSGHDREANLRRNMAMIEQMQRQRAALAPSSGGPSLGGARPATAGLSLGGVTPAAGPQKPAGFSLGGAQPQQQGLTLGGVQAKPQGSGANVSLL